MKNAIFAITLAVALPAWGKDDNPFVTGNQFLETCQKPSNLAGCLGYVRGIHDFIRLNETGSAVANAWLWLVTAIAYVQGSSCLAATRLLCEVSRLGGARTM